MAYLTLNGDFITLNGDRLVLNGGAAPIRRGWDDGGELKRFWQARADKWIAENLPVVRKAAKAKVSRTIIIETLTAAAEMETPPMPVSALDDFVTRLSSPTADYTAVAAEVLTAMLDQQRRAKRRRRDNEAILILSW